MSATPPIVPGPDEPLRPPRLSARRPVTGVVVTALVAGCVALLVLATLVWLKTPSRIHVPAEPTGPRRIEPEKSFAN
jgi:hypothetical protein